MQKVFDSYLNHLTAERNASPYTVRNYTRDLLDFFNYLKEERVVSLNEVDRPLMRRYLTHLGKRGYVRVSISRKLSAIRSFYGYLLREKLIEVSPMTNISPPRMDRRLPHFLTAEETVRLLTAPDPATPQGQRDRALIELLYASGLRVSELVSLDLGQVNLDSGEIRVRGKGDKERMVLIGKPAAQALTTYLEYGRRQLLGGRPGFALFTNRRGGRLSGRSVQRLLSKYGRQAGIGQPVHPHLLRHTFATHMLDGGADLRVVQELLGHADLVSTQIYTHVSGRRARQVYLAAHPLAGEDKDDS
jgi:integrase/recombinase XerC